MNKTLGAVVVAVGVVILTPLMAFMALGDPPPAREPSPAATADIPPDLLTAYGTAAAGCALPWEVLAAIGKVASDHGRIPGPAGLMGFLPPATENGADPVRVAAGFLCGQGATDPARVPAALAAFNPALDPAQVLAVADSYRAPASSPTPPPAQPRPVGP